MRDCKWRNSAFSTLFSVSNSVIEVDSSVFSVERTPTFTSNSPFKAFLRSLEAWADFLLASNRLAYFSSSSFRLEVRGRTAEAMDLDARGTGVDVRGFLFDNSI